LRKGVIATLVCVALILLVILSACGQTGDTTTVTATKTVTSTVGSSGGTSKVETVYKVLNPAGIYIPVECKPNAPRLDSLNGKKILYYESEATNILMPTLLAKLKKDYPTATFTVVHTESFGENTPTADQLKNDAVIRGVGW